MGNSFIDVSRALYASEASKTPPPRCFCLYRRPFLAPNSEKMESETVKTVFLSHIKRISCVSDGAELHQASDRVLVQRVLSDGVVQDGRGRVLQVRVGGAGQGALRRAARRLVWAGEVLVVVMEVVQVEVMVAAGVEGGVPQRQDVGGAGRQGRLRRGQVGAGAGQRGGLGGQRGEDDRVAVETRSGRRLQDELGALNALILVALRGQEGVKPGWTPQEAPPPTPTLRLWSCVEAWLLPPPVPLEWETLVWGVSAWIRPLLSIRLRHKQGDESVQRF